MNSVNMIGNLTRDVEKRFNSRTGELVCGETAIAINENYRKKDTGDLVEKVSYIPIVAYGKSGELMINYLKKGDRIAVSGKLTQERWNDEEGKPHSKISVIVSKITFLTPKKVENGAEIPKGATVNLDPNQQGTGGEITSIHIEDNEIPF